MKAPDKRCGTCEFLRDLHTDRRPARITKDRAYTCGFHPELPPMPDAILRAQHFGHIKLSRSAMCKDDGQTCACWVKRDRREA